MPNTRTNPLEHLRVHAMLGELVVEAVRQSGILRNARRPYTKSKATRRPHRRTRTRRTAPVEAVPVAQ